MSYQQVREIDLHLTNRCNLTCAHCSVDSGRTRWEEMALQVWLDVIQSGVELGCRYYDLTGGEPLLYPGVEELIEAIVRKGVHLELQSNGLLLSDERLDRAWQAGLRELVISLDGDRRQHDTVRGLEGCFDIAVSAIRRAVKRGFRVRATRVVVDEDSCDKLEEFAFLLETLGVSHLSINHFSPVTPLHFTRLLDPRPQRWLALTEKLESLAPRLSFPVSYEVGYVQPAEVEEFFSEETRCLIQRRKWLLVRSDGEVYPCYHFVHRPEMSLGNVQERDLRDILESEAGWQAYQEVNNPPPQCSGCKFNSPCRGGCPSPGYLQLGDLNQKDPRCRVESGYIPVCPFVKRTAGSTHQTNISPYYYQGSPS